MQTPRSRRISRKAIDDPGVSEEEAEEDEPRKRHEKITLERFIDHGPSPGCTACSEGLDNHTPACRQRFDELIRKTKFDLPDGIPRDRDSWKIEGSKLIRYHCIKRKRLFAPTKTYELPVPRARIGKRITQIQFVDGGEVETIPSEEWRGNTKALRGFWTGISTFDILEEGDAVPAEVHDVRRDLSSRRTKVLHQQNLPGYGIFIECCCDPNSGLGNVSEQIGLSRIRATSVTNKS